jgi:preprotein translocase subunit SecG
MEEEDITLGSSESTNDNLKENSKREFLSKIFIILGVAFAYGLLAFEGCSLSSRKEEKQKK